MTAGLLGIWSGDNNADASEELRNDLVCRGAIGGFERFDGLSELAMLPSILDASSRRDLREDLLSLESWTLVSTGDKCT
jgi:hypothetical protein